MSLRKIIVWNITSEDFFKPITLFVLQVSVGGGGGGGKTKKKNN